MTAVSASFRSLENIAPDLLSRITGIRLLTGTQDFFPCPTLANRMWLHPTILYITGSIFQLFYMYQERGEGRSRLVFVPIFGNDCNSKQETLKKATLKSQDETYQLNSLFLQNLQNTCKNSRLLYLCTGHGFCKVRRYIHQYLKGKEESFYT